MARIRTIKPELPSDPTLSSVSIECRLTFVYMISQADDYGLLPGTPRQLLGMLYPHDTEITERKLTAWVHGLADAGIIRWRSTTDGVPVVQLVNWEKHQRIDNRGKSLLHERLVEEDSPSVAATRGEIPLGPRSYSSSPSEVHGPRSGEWAEDFETAWLAYPRKSNNPKGKAKKAYMARRKEGVTAEALLLGVVAYRGFLEREGTDPKFIKNASTFFGPDEHWLTDYAPVPRATAPHNAKPTPGDARQWALDAIARQQDAA